MDEIKINERERTNKLYNLQLLDYVDLEEDKFQMPIIYREDFIPESLTGFNYALNKNNGNAGIHFYLDDYQFERVWTSPDKYINTLRRHTCALSPDFSLYMDMPEPMKIWNTYRSRLIGAYYQALGIKIIPTLSWADEKSYKYCFKGIEQGGVVSISTIGVKRYKEALEIWHNGVDEMIKQIKPSTILVYGGEIEHDYKGVNVVYYKNEVTERLAKLNVSNK